jgi:hypothetical protein
VRQKTLAPGMAPSRGRPTRSRLATGLLAGFVTAVGLAAPGVAGAAVTAPANDISFPSRDFVSSTGYNLNNLFTVEVQHPDGRVVGTVTDVAPKDDGEGGGLGIIEVNHPGGACWVGQTPDIRPGDIVRIKNQDTLAVDESTVRNVTASRPVASTDPATGRTTLQIHGTAQDAAGNPLPLGELEQRLVTSSKDPFDVNGKRTIRATSAAGSEGTLAYDAAGSTKWTATYTGLAQADIDRALGAESRGMWIDPALPSTQSTIFENGAAATAGPSAPCTAPLEKLPPPPGSETTPPSDVTGLKGSAANSTVTLNWSAATDNVGVTDYGIYRTDAAGVTTAVATVQNADGTPNPPTTFTDQNVAPGQYTYTVDAGDAIGNRSVNMSNAVTVTTSVNPANPATAPAPTGAHGLIGFPQRDFISATGYTPGVSYTFSVIRGGNVVSTSSPVVADSTGLAEVNHPGGGCWTGMTPNIQPGDTIRISGGGLTEQTSVAGVTDERPIVTSVDPTTGGGTVEVHGTAVAPGGGQLPLDQIEQRLVARNDSFDINGRRTIRAGAGLDGTLAYDSATSTRFTAKYTLQTPNDLARAVGGKSTSGTSFDGSESRILWLGNAPAAGNELTIYENGPAIAGGPAAGISGCTSGPAEVPAPNVALPTLAPKFPTTAVGSTSTTQDVTITNSGTAPLHLDRAYLAGLNRGDFVLTVPAGTNGSVVDPGKSATVTVAFKPSAAGTSQANLSFADDAANTTDQTLALTGSTPAAPGAASTAPVQSLAAVFNDPIQLFTPLANSKLPVDLTWSNNGGTGATSELQMATGNSTANIGAFQPVTLTPNTATSTRVYLAMGNSTGLAYQFRVRACNAGVCGGWATGPKFTLVPADDASIPAGQFKGTWTNTTVAGSYGGTVRRASGSAQATLVPAVQYTVSGNAAWVTTLGPNQGLAQVQVDNGKPEVVDMYSATEQPRRVVWARDAMAAGTHTVTVTVLGKKSTLNPNACNTGTKCAQVDIDAGILIK